MDTDEASHLTIFLSVMLGGIAMQAVVVAAFRILQILRAGDPASLPRIITLAAFALFMGGTIGRDLDKAEIKLKAKMSSLILNGTFE
jgi:hypothetical protein